VIESLLDVDAVSKQLSRVCGDADRPRVVAATVLADSPGKRTVVAYRIEDAHGSRLELIGKAFEDPARAARLHSVLNRLYPQRTSESSVPRPVALLPEMGLSLQERAGGRPLDQLHGAARSDALTIAARWLSTLHRLDIRFERTVNLTSELRKIGEWGELLADRQPASATAAAQLAARLVSMAAHLEFSPAVPIHKDFQYQHVFAEPGHVTVIDLDEVRSGDPVLDAAHFCAYLHLLAVREGLAEPEAAQLESTFLDAYAGDAGYARDDRHRFFYAYSCLKIAKQLARGKGPAPVPAGEALAVQLCSILEEGLCAAG
jgi:aminoglycoside phosphotransferase (APT) family kinase protein